MLRRIVYLGYLSCVALTTVLCFIGICLENPVTLLGAVGAGLSLLALRSWLLHHPAGVSEEGEEDEEDWVWEKQDYAAARPRVKELVGLLQEMDEMEKARGSSHFDPWELRSVQGEIRSLVKHDRLLRNTLGVEKG